MQGLIKIGEREIPMAANAASPYVYRNIFKEDFLQKIQEKVPEADIFQKMGFVMAKQAETSKMSELMNITIDDYYGWLMEFEPLAILEAAGDISGLYMGQEKTMSVPKNEGV